MADKAAVLNPEDMTYEQLIEATNNQIVAEAEKQVPARDEKGQFVKAEDTPQDTPPVVEEVTPTAPAEKLVYQHVIDLEDGSGSQVFEADSMEELVKKLGDAQKHASKKIRELSLEKRAEKVVETAPTDDQEWLVAQELTTKPTQTMKKLFEDMVGMPLDSFKTQIARVNAFEQAQREESEAQRFVAAHPEYITNERNANKLSRSLELQGLDKSFENIEKVYAELTADGLLAIKEADSTPNTDDTVTPTSRIASSGARVVSVQGRAASGISSRRSAPPAVKPTEPTEAELYAMPYDKLEAYYATKAAQQQK